MLRVFDSPNGLRMLAQIAVSQAGVAPGKRKVGVQLDRPVVQPQRGLRIPVQKRPDVAGNSEGARVFRIEQDRFLRQLVRALDGSRRIGFSALADGVMIPMRQP